MDSVFLSLRSSPAEFDCRLQHMTDDNSAAATESIVRKDLDDADRTDEFAAGHYSSAEVAAMCHATEGQQHE